MIRLGHGIDGPMTVPLGLDVVVTCRPLDDAVMALAEARARRRFERETEDEEIDPDAEPDEDAETAREARLRAIHAQELAALVVEAWDGVGAADGAGPAPCTPATVRALVREWPFCETFSQRVRAVQAGLLAAKKDCGPSPDGTSAAGPGTADRAAKPAPPAPADAPAPTATAAPTTATPPARGRKPRSGAPS